MSKRFIIRSILFIAVIGGVAIVGYVNRQELIARYYGQKSYKVYKAYHVMLPSKYNVHGIDVSHHQGRIDWELVSKMQVDSVKVDFAFIKATEGKNHRDRTFKYNWKQAKKRQIIRGAYHYFKSNVSGIDQAKNFIKRVKLQKGDLPPVLDVEEKGSLSKADLVKEIKAFLNYVENYYKVEPILYSFHDFYKLNLKGSFNRYPLWIAHYYVIKPKNKTWNFWQLSDRSTVSGINTPVDFNVFNRDLKSLQKILKK